MTANTAKLIDLDAENWSTYDRLNTGTSPHRYGVARKRRAVPRKDIASITSSLILLDFEGTADWVSDEVDGFVRQKDSIDDLKKIVRKRLGYRTAYRLNRLASYEQGWGDHESKALSVDSAAQLTYFLDQFHSFDSRPSLFLTDDGYLELAWEDRSGEEISITFHDGGCYVEKGAQVKEYPILGPEQIQNIARSLAE